MKQTKQKDAILKKVKDLRIHPTADEIYKALKDDGEKIGLATVYRNLNRFSEVGAIKKVEMFDQSDRFDFRLDDHQHLLCEKCGKVLDIDVNINLNFENENVKINNYKVIFYGICGGCSSEFD